MGFIYVISFRGKVKKYIGQTRRTIANRKSEHIYKSSYLDEDQGCWLLNRKIRKYGEFDMEILIECDDDDLNMWEIFFIELYNSVYPNGYNLTKGGNVPILNEVSRLKISQKIRKYNIDMNLPIHVHRKVDYTGEGFVVSVPEYKKRQFCNNNLGDINHKKELALQHLRDINDGKVPKKVKKEYPLYLMKTKQNDKPCFEINNPKYKICRYFFNENNKEEMLEKAKEYHRTTVDGTAPIRSKLRKNPLFEGPDMDHIQDRKGGAIVYLPNGKTKSFASRKFTVEKNIEEAKKFRNEVYKKV